MAASRRPCPSRGQRRDGGRGVWLVAGLLAGWGWAGGVAASTLLDRAETVAANGATEVRITFARPIAYRRHAPAREGQIVRIELDAPGAERTRARDEEYLRVPPTAGAPGYFVLHRPAGDSDAPTAPFVLTVQFDAPTRYALRPGADGRSLILAIPAKRDGGAPATGAAAE